MADSLKYIPGTCNIGLAEIQRRRDGAIFSFLLSIIVIVFLITTDANRIWRLILFIPASSFAISFQQWYLKFCVAFGLKGLFNFGEIGKTDSVQEAEFRKKDRAKASKMILLGTSFGLVVAVIFYYSPV